MHSLQKMIAARLCLAVLATNVAAQDAERFYPEALQQNGRVTLTPSFTPDGNTLYFAQSDCSPIWECPQQLRRSDRTADGWSEPVDVVLPRPGRVDWPNVTPDGKTLVFSWSATRDELAALDIRENFDLYTLDLTRDGAVPKPIRTGDINRPRAGSVKTLRFVHNESLPSITHNGSLYFMTERLDGIGERDIYRAQRNADGSFDTAMPLAPPITTPQRDDGVWVNADETVMLLSYSNRGGSGGVDVFVAFGENGAWATPVNVGTAINSRFADFAARLSPDNQTIVFTSDRPFADQERGLLQVWSAPIDLDALRWSAKDNSTARGD